ncbi:MAG: hypothetical protein P4L99_23995 [Chthoniobacter sp.]|nr:hypothetical protein [Chthoniobacter sp.]
MKPISRLLPAFLAAAFLLGSCAAAPRRVAFQEADFAGAGRTGSGTVTGNAFIVTWDGRTLPGGFNEVVLYPVNAYTTEEMKRQYEHGENLESRDARSAQYVRTGQTDGLGDFAFRHVPPGNYYVGSGGNWSNWYWNDDGTKATVDHLQRIYAQISVKDGQTVNVTHWIQGKSKTL